MSAKKPSHRLKAVYAKIPGIVCKGLCHDTCGPILVARDEAQMMQRRGDLSFREECCPFLDPENRCGVHAHRPAICRLYGVADDPKMRCPHGCEPERLLSNQEAGAILHEIVKVGGSAVLIRPRRSRVESFDSGAPAD